MKLIVRFCTGIKRLSHVILTARSSLRLAEYSLSQQTLEQIFIELVRSSEQAAEGAETAAARRTQREIKWITHKSIQAYL